MLEVIDHYYYYHYYYHYYLIIDSLLLIIITTRCKFKLYIKFRKKIFLAMKSQSMISCFMFRFNPCKYIQCMSLIVIMLFVNFNKSSSLYFPSNQSFIITKRSEKTWTFTQLFRWGSWKGKVFSLTRSQFILIFLPQLSCPKPRVTLTRKYYCALAALAPGFLHLSIYLDLRILRRQEESHIVVIVIR